MATTVLPGPVQNDARIREAVSIHTNKIFDSCKDKDCIEDLRVFLIPSSQALLNTALSCRAKNAELLYADVNVDAVTYNRGCFTVDVCYYYKITAEVYTVGSCPSEVMGLAIFNKRVILFGSESCAKVFSSNETPIVNGCNGLNASNLPIAYVEAVDPVILSVKLSDSCCACSDLEIINIPEFISREFGGDIIFDPSQRRMYVTLGQFSIIRLERPSQLVVPAYNYYIPEKECDCNSDDDPCARFDKVCFPVDEFFPPDCLCAPDGYREARAACGR